MRNFNHIFCTIIQPKEFYAGVFCVFLARNYTESVSINFWPQCVQRQSCNVWFKTCYLPSSSVQSFLGKYISLKNLRFCHSWLVKGPIHVYVMFYDICNCFSEVLA